MPNTSILESDRTHAAAEGAIRSDLLEQLAKPEVQEALTMLIDQLPKLAEISVQLTKAYDFAHQALSDDVLRGDITKGFKEFAAPIEQKAKGLAIAAMEAKDRADRDNETIGVFGLLKMLKNPELQRMLRFGQAFLDVMGERRK